MHGPINIKNTDTLAVATKETGLEVNDDKTKYMVMCWDQNVGRSHNTKIENSSFERVEEFKYFQRILTNQSSIQEEIKIRIVARECLLLFGADIFVFQFAVRNK